jgi:adenosine deaminase
MSNLIFKYSYDTRLDASAFIFAIGIPITINPDDPGKFGYEDTTCDYFLAAVSYNWSLRNFKIIGYHSINHAVGISHENKK